LSIRIKSVAADSLGEFLGLSPGDQILKINGTNVLDQLDYQFRIIDPNPILELEIGGKRELIHVDKEEDVDLGVDIEDFKVRGCANDCVFCFVDQNPQGLRHSLYFRDGDYRMSFLYGHYITLTNMGWKELDRIVEQRLSPLYISVHATDPDLRRELLLYGKEDHLLDKLRYLVDHGITLHSQIVLCPGLNDGAQLERTLDDLVKLTPGLKSVAIVPVGLTGHRQGLRKLASVTPVYARKFVDDYVRLSEKYYHADGNRFVLLSDEWYIVTERSIPEAELYAGLAMEENGVGQVRAFLDQFTREQTDFPQSFDRERKFTIATGTLAAPVFNQHILPSLNSITNLQVDCVQVKNTLLGEPVTVAGLLSGADFINALKGREAGEAVWTTDRILNDGDNITLDNMGLEDISKAIGTPFNVTADSILEIFERDING